MTHAVLDLPIEIHHSIFANLNYKSLRNFTSTNHHFHGLLTPVILRRSLLNTEPNLQKPLPASLSTPSKDSGGPVMLASAF